MLTDAQTTQLISEAKACTVQFASMLRDASIIGSDGSLSWIDMTKAPAFATDWSVSKHMDASLAYGLGGVAFALNQAYRASAVTSFHVAADAAKKTGQALVGTADTASKFVGTDTWWDSQQAKQVLSEKTGKTTQTGYVGDDIIATWGDILAGAPVRAALCDTACDFIVNGTSDRISNGRCGLLALMPTAVLTRGIADAIIWMMADLKQNGPRDLAVFGQIRWNYISGLAGLVATLAGLADYPRHRTMGGHP